MKPIIKPEYLQNRKSSNTGNRGLEMARADIKTVSEEIITVAVGIH